MTDDVESQDQGPGVSRAAPSHCDNFERAVVTPAARLFDLLWPGATSFAISAALNSRVSPAHVRMWRTGARPLPQWIRDLATARMRAIGDTLEAAPTGPGREAGWCNVAGYLANR